MPAPGSLDFRALTAPVDPVRLRHFRDRLASVPLSDPVPPPDPTGDAIGRRLSAGAIAWIVVFACGWALLGLFVGYAMTGIFAGNADGPLSPLAVAGGEVLGFVIAAVIVFLVANSTVLQLRRVAIRRYRMDAFARANGMVTAFQVRDPGYPGAIFGIGKSRAAYDCLRTLDAPTTEVGCYRYETGSDKNKQVHEWGYLAQRLREPLPHMVLDSRANNGPFGATNLPTSFARNQVLHLEGDFYRYFTLYCPKDYERDALYVFTPDLMALLIDEAAAFDVEVVDDWLFVYASRHIDTADPATLQRLFHIADTVGAKTESRADRYRDERSAPSAPAQQPDGYPASRSIARAGRRLRPGTNVMATVFVVLAFAAWALFMLVH